MMNKIDEIFKRALKDRDIFFIKKEIFSNKEWKELNEARKERVKYENLVKQKIQDLKSKKGNESDNRKKKDIENAIELCDNMLNAIKIKPNILNQMFNYLDSYGLVQCNLPAMDDYGKVIERYGISTVEQFFLDKIKREQGLYKRKALAKVLEYVKDLYNSNQATLEIAYFVRKLDSLTIFWEV